MSKKSTAVALTTELPAAGSTITRSQAVAIANQIAKEKLAAAREERKAAQAAIEREIGRITGKVDQETVDITRRLMARVAMIEQKSRAQHTTNGYYQAPHGSSSSKLPGIVSKLGAIAGELEAIMLTDRALGLFEPVRTNDFTGDEWEHKRALQGGAISSAVGKKSRADVDAALSVYEIVDDPKAEPATKGKRGRRDADAPVIPDHMVQAQADDVDDLDDDDDLEANDDAGAGDE